MENMNTETLHALALELSREDMKGRRLTETTQKMMLKDQEDFLLWVGNKNYSLALMGKHEILEYHSYICLTLSKKSGEPLAPATINNRFAQAMILFSLLYREGILADNPAQNLGLELSEGSFMKRRPLTQDEITVFLEHIDPSTPQGLKDRTLFELIYSSGLRVSEAAGLKVRDIDFNRREMIVRGKFGKDRVIPISRVAHDFLVLHLGKRIENPEAWVFVGFRRTRPDRHIQSGSISERFHDLSRRYGIAKKEVSAHSIRHSTATHLLENGASVRHVQELLGHKNIETTVRYTHLQTDSLFKTYRKYHPREHELFETIDETYLKRFDSIAKRKKE
jgi:site-specific recombinase XerD